VPLLKIVRVTVAAPATCGTANDVVLIPIISSTSLVEDFILFLPDES
jgi:hypothetical protein